MTRPLATVIVGLFVLALAPTGGFPAPVPPAPKDDAKTELGRLAGKWKIASITKNGKEEEFDETKATVTFRKDGSWVWEHNGAHGETSRIDPTKRPKEIDWTDGAGEHAITDKLIYTLEGDMFVCCSSAINSKDRPTEFKTTAENGWTVIVYKRVKND